MLLKWFPSVVDCLLLSGEAMIFNFPVIDDIYKLKLMVSYVHVVWCDNKLILKNWKIYKISLRVMSEVNVIILTINDIS